MALPFPQGLWGAVMVVTCSYSGALETGWTDGLKKSFHQPVKPLALVAEREHVGRGDHEENGLLCFCSNRCGFEVNIQLEPELPEGCNSS